jgi:predicted ATP-grasp superfamily ATP-dependent carboligase
MARLYWLLTQSPNVARYPSDVRYFGEVQKLVTDNQQEIDKIEQLIKDYESEVKG